MCIVIVDNEVRSETAIMNRHTPTPLLQLAAVVMVVVVVIVVVFQL